MRGYRLGNKGATWIWLTVLLGLGVLALVFIPLNDVVQNCLYPVATNELNADQTTCDMFQIIWTALPFLIMIGLMWWAFTQAQKREDYY